MVTMMNNESAAQHAVDNAREQQRSLVSAFAGAELSLDELWLRYFEMGGTTGHFDIEAYIHGLGQLPDMDRDILAHTVNERLDELTTTRRALYSRTLRDPIPRSAPLSALLTLLEGTQLAPPDRLAEITDAAGQAIGVHITVYLVDYDQRYLHPISPAEPGAETFEVDTTLPGRAYRLVQQLPSASSGQPRLWVPLLDGSERLGVLDVRFADPADLHDPGLRTQCRWLSSLLGHLVTIMTDYGDLFDQIRLRTPRTPSAELIWSMLPPLTAGVDNFVVAGALEPRHDINGDAFDYALSARSAQLLVVDAVGHDPRSGLIAATALAAYRSARHAGHGLYEQARTIDEAINAQFGDSIFATGVLADLELSTGRLRYVNAGHPEPLIMRAGKMIKPLSGGRRLPLGLGSGELTVAEATLQPEDWLVLYTDGVTEARDDTGEFFGTDRLVDFLRREAAAGYPPPETSRRLIKAILDHQQGALQDDATILLARWTQPDPRLDR